MSRADFFKGLICRGPIWQRADSSSSPVQYNAKVEKSPPNVDEYALLFDIDNTALDSHVFNTIMRKKSWKIFTDILQNNCADFSAWKSQSDFQFGFAPLSNLVVGNNQGHIEVKVADPIAQHFSVKAYGVLNFLGARIPVASQLNVMNGNMN